MEERWFKLISKRANVSSVMLERVRTGVEAQLGCDRLHGYEQSCGQQSSSVQVCKRELMAIFVKERGRWAERTILRTGAQVLGENLLGGHESLCWVIPIGCNALKGIETLK